MNPKIALAGALMASVSAAAAAAPATYYRQTPAPVALNSQTAVTVLSVSVPAGNWSITGTATLDPNINADAAYGECAIFVNGNYYGTNRQAIGSFNGFFASGNIVSQAALSLSKTTTVSLGCRTNNPYTGGQITIGSLLVTTAYALK